MKEGMHQRRRQKLLLRAYKLRAQQLISQKLYNYNNNCQQEKQYGEPVDTMHIGHKFRFR